jgi:hypothetical protein
MRPFRAVVFFACLSLLCCVSAAQSFLQTESMRDFDGREWSGIRLGRMNDSDIKKRFKVEKGAIRPEALKFVMEKGSTVRVDALLDGRGGKAVVRALRVEYLGRDPYLMQLVDDWDERPEMFYQKGRTEDWHLEVFEKRGVIAVVLGPEMRSNVDCFILMDPDRVGVVTRQFVERPTRIEPPRDPGEGWDRKVSFNWVTANASASGNRPDWMSNRWIDDLESALKDEAKFYRGSMLRGNGDKGSLSIRVSGSQFRDSSGRWSVNLSLNTSTPYGDLTAFSDDSRTISGNSRGRIVDLLRSALDEMDSNVRRQAREFGPEPKDAARKRAMELIYKAASDS